VRFGFCVIILDTNAGVWCDKKGVVVSHIHEGIIMMHQVVMNPMSSHLEEKPKK